MKKIRKIEKHLQRFESPAHHWYFTILDDNVGWFEKYLQLHKHQVKNMVAIPIDLTQGFNLFEYSLRKGFKRFKDNAAFIDINNTSSFVYFLFRMDISG